MEAEAGEAAEKEKQMCKSVHWELDETEAAPLTKRALEQSHVVCPGVQ